MAQHKNEHRDAYIAAIVGGVALVLIYLYLHAGTNAIAADLGTPLGTQPVDASATPAAGSPYNYNVAPYDPGTPIQYAFPSMFPSGESGCGCGGVSGITPCSPITGTNLYQVNVDQYQSLVSANG